MPSSSKPTSWICRRGSLEIHLEACEPSSFLHFIRGTGLRESKPACFLGCCALGSGAAGCPCCAACCDSSPGQPAPSPAGPRPAGQLGFTPPSLLLFPLLAYIPQRGAVMPSPPRATRSLHSLSKGKALQSHHLPGQSVGVCRKPGFYAGCILPGVC